MFASSLRHARTGGDALMNPHSLESNYVSLANLLETKAIGLAQQWPAVKGFWERWCQTHRNIARNVSAEDGVTWQKQENDPRWDDFLKLRQRLVSTLGQGMNSTFISAEMRDALRALLAEHDKAFVDLLHRELELVKRQMTQAIAVKKTVSAYAQTAQYRRE